MMLILFLDLYLLQNLVAVMPQHDFAVLTAAVHQACTTGVMAHKSVAWLAFVCTSFVHT